jgi:hypothetical protein
MLSRRRFRWVTALLAVISLLFMQLAVAAYACPAVALGTGQNPTLQMDSGAAPCASHMRHMADEQPPGLCFAHCHANPQSLDKHEIPQPVAMGALPVNFTVVQAAPTPVAPPLQAPHLLRTGAPPLAIQHCCFRI